MICELLDFKCIFVNELIGSTLLTLVVGAIFYFIVASKAKWGFDTTIGLLIPILAIIGLAFGSITTIFAFATIVSAIMIAWIFSKIFGN